MNEHVCASCGEIIPQGRDICWACEHGYTPDKRENYKETTYDIRVSERTEDEVSTEK
jgi:hypothetical protein